MIEKKFDVCVCNYNIINGISIIKNNAKLNIQEKDREKLDYVLDINYYGGYCWNKMYKRSIAKVFTFLITLKLWEI